MVALRHPRPSWPLVATLLSAVACKSYEPPLDLDTSTSGLGTEHSEDDEIDDTVVYEGKGHGTLFFPRLRDSPELVGSPLARSAIVIGAPDEAWEGVVGTGQLSILLDNGHNSGYPVDVLEPPSNAPHTIVEGLHSSVCPTKQRFAWQLLPDRRLGRALSFYGRWPNADYVAYENVLLAGAPDAGAHSGRVMSYINCHSCALFPRADGVENLTGGQFGSSVAVGFFAEDEEWVAIGAPKLGGSGRVAILGKHNFNGWWLPHFHSDSMLRGVRECQCEFDQSVGNYQCKPWDETLQGSYPNEEFGASMTAGDLDCDGLDDLVVGAPGADLPAMNPPTIPDAGAVYVYFNAPDPLGAVAPTVLRQGTPEVGGTPEPGDRFGTTLVIGNFNGARRLGNNQKCFDLVVGTPNEADGAGQIQVFYGSPGGLVFSGPVLTLDDIFGASADPGDRFGYALVAGDFNGDGFHDLAIGAPGDEGGGSVTIIPGSSDGLNLDDATWFRQGDGVEGNNVEGDEFGYALTWSRVGIGSGNPFIVLAVGVPGKNGNIGRVNLYRTSEGKMIFLHNGTFVTQGMIQGDMVAGDRFGSTLLQPRAMPHVPYL